MDLDAPHSNWPNDPGDILRRKYDFRWEVLDVLIGGKSLIDTNMGLSGFPMSKSEDADRFLRSYGFNLDDTIEQAEVLGNLHEAIGFVRKFFLQPENSDGLKVEIPRKILELTDVRDLLLLANCTYPGQSPDTQGTYLRNWACSLLKVVHAIAHIDKDVRTVYLPDIQKQILDRFYKIIQRDNEGNLFLAEKLDDPTRVHLVSFETKPRKSRESILLKLLHKPESVGEDIFDRVGIRFITKTPLDGLRAIKYLKDKLAVMPPNIKPSRSRNTLVEIDQFKTRLNELKEKLFSGKLNSENFEVQLEKAARPTDQENTENPHSSKYYHSIQFTCRQLIKLKNPMFETMKSLKGALKEHVLPDPVNKLIEQIDLQYVRRETRFFFPYEVQITDEKSHRESMQGKSSHSEYKKAQVQTAMRRVMGPLIHAQGA